MTGFARVRRTIHELDVVVSLKSVNHRALDLQFHIGADLDPFENAMRTLIKRCVSRGHVDVRIHVTRAATVGVMGIDAARLEGYVIAFKKAAKQHKLDQDPDLNSALRIPGMLTDSVQLELSADFEKPLIDTLEEALLSLNEFRSREGAELAKVMKEHGEAIHSAALKMEKIRTRALTGFHTRLKERLADLLNGAAVDPQRLAQEAAILADRSDIGEEIARLKIHAKQVGDILAHETEIGKKLDFLLQEMNRETNTILSKTSGVGEAGLGITEVALAAKSNIEKIREQALNLE
jgi:uncharacterized protein (TIGR00255 family)